MVEDIGAKRAEGGEKRSKSSFLIRVCGKGKTQLRKEGGKKKKKKKPENKIRYVCSVLATHPFFVPHSHSSNPLALSTSSSLSSLPLPLSLSLPVSLPLPFSLSFSFSISFKHSHPKISKKSRGAGFLHVIISLSSLIESLLLKGKKHKKDHISFPK